MNRLSAYDIVRNPVVTEKSTLASENNQVVFDVAIDANKTDIKAAVVQLWTRTLLCPPATSRISTSCQCRGSTLCRS
jgi:ribosomal protein L23